MNLLYLQFFFSCQMCFNSGLNVLYLCHTDAVVVSGRLFALVTERTVLD